MVVANSRRFLCNPAIIWNTVKVARNLRGSAPPTSREARGPDHNSDPRYYTERHDFSTAQSQQVHEHGSQYVSHAPHPEQSPYNPHPTYGQHHPTAISGNHQGYVSNPQSHAHNHSYAAERSSISAHSYQDSPQGLGDGLHRTLPPIHPQQQHSGRMATYATAPYLPDTRAGRRSAIGNSGPSLPLEISHESLVGREGYPSQTAMVQPKARFTTEDDALLRHLKEERESPKLSWRQIADFFPGRKSGTLQVRYCTKLKVKDSVNWDRALVSFKLRTLAWQHTRIPESVCTVRASKNESIH